MGRNHILGWRLLGIAGLATMAGGLPVLPALADSYTLTDITTPIVDGFSLSVPSVEVTDANIPEASIRALFAGQLGGVGNDLATLNAKSIVIPTITLDFTPTAADWAAKPIAITYSDIELADVQDGVAGSTMIGGVDMANLEGATFHIGKLTTGTFSIAGLLGLYGLIEHPAGDAMQVIYADMNFAGGSFTVENVTCSIGAASLSEFSARPLKTSLVEFMTLAQSLDTQSKPNPAAVAKLLGFYADLLTAFSSTPSSFDGFDCAGKDEKGADIAISTGPLGVDGYAPGVYPAISLDDLKIASTGNSIELGNITVKATDLNGPISVLKSLPAMVDEAWFTANARKLIPAFEGFSFAGFAADIADEENAGKRIKLSVGSFDLSLADYINGIPAAIAVAGRHIVADVPTGTEGPAQELAAIGIEHLDMGFDLDLHWDKPSQTIVIDKLGSAGTNLGAVAISGTLGNATEALFAEDTNVAMAAGLGLTVKDVTIDISDQGLATLLYSVAATHDGKSEADERTGVAGMAQAMSYAMFGGTDQAAQLGKALNDFVMGKPTVTITLTAKDPTGIPLTAFTMAMQNDPTVLAQLLSVTATTSDTLPPVDDEAMDATDRTDATN